MFLMGYKILNVNIIKKEKMNIVEDVFYIINGIFVNVVLMIRLVCCVVLIYLIY